MSRADDPRYYFYLVYEYLKVPRRWGVGGEVEVTMCQSFSSHSARGRPRESGRSWSQRKRDSGFGSTTGDKAALFRNALLSSAQRRGLEKVA